MEINPSIRTLRAKNIGALIRGARLAAGRSKKECAEVIRVPGAMFEEYEQGNKSPSLPELEGLAYYLEVSLEQFWEEEEPVSTDGGDPKKTENMEQLIGLRQRMIGALIRQARLERDYSLETLAERSRLDVQTLERYELGEASIPIPQLELLCSALNRSIKEFCDRDGPVGVWDRQRRAIQDFLLLSPEMQGFVSKPVNRPYLELAKRLSDMSVDKLRAVAEGLLEITY